MDCNSPGSSVHGIFQARILEWVAISFSRGSSPPRDGTCVSCIVGRFFTTRETLVLIYTHVILFYKQKSLCNIIIYSLNAQWVKNPPAVRETQEMQVWSLGGEDPLEEGVVTHSSILAWRISWTEDPDGLQSVGLQRVRYDWSDLTHIHCKEIRVKSRNESLYALGGKMA